MKGLLIKDLCIIKMQAKFLALILIIGVFMAFNLDNPSFVIGYMSYMGAILTMNTMSYDEFENGNAFLFSLPITRKMYAREKYVLGIVFGGVLWAFSALLCVLFELYTGAGNAADIAETALWVLPLLFVGLAAVIPIQLKFGGEKGKIVVVAALGVMVGLCAVLVKITENSSFNMNMLYERFSFLSGGLIISAAFVISLALLFLSYMISVRIVEKKEF